MKAFFWLCVVGAVYSYLLYPLLLLVLVPKRRVAPGGAGIHQPRVTIVVACRNEERRLRAKLQNALAVAYPNREILVASDASDDASDAIVSEFAGQGVILVRSPERRAGIAAVRASVRWWRDRRR